VSGPGRSDRRRQYDCKLFHLNPTLIGPNPHRPALTISTPRPWGLPAAAIPLLMPPRPALGRRDSVICAELKLPFKTAMLGFAASRAAKAVRADSFSSRTSSGYRRRLSQTNTKLVLFLTFCALLQNDHR
jgi:hypothetical protein